MTGSNSVDLIIVALLTGANLSLLVKPGSTWFWRTISGAGAATGIAVLGVLVEGIIQ